MTSWPPSWKYDVKLKIQLYQSMLIYAKNIPAKFHPDPIWNDRALQSINQSIGQSRFFKVVLRFFCCRWPLLGTVYHLSWDVLLWTLLSGVVWRRSCSLELMVFLLLITLSSRVSCRGLEGAVRPFGRRLGWSRCTASQLVYFCYVFNP